MQFLVTCAYNWGVGAESFRVVEAPSRLAVAAHIVEDSDLWSKFLHDARLYDPIVRGDRPYYADPQPVTAEAALRLIDHSSTDDDIRARMSIHPINEVLNLSPSMSRIVQAALNNPGSKP